MDQQKRQYILLVLLIAAVLVGGYYNWQEQRDFAASATAPTDNRPVLDTSADTKPEIVVYVSGYVVRPGVYKLAGEPRAIDFVNAAGGFAAGANPDGVNLAQKMIDGMQIHVPGNLKTTDTVSTAAVGGKISINTADKKQLESLPGIGPALADRILEYRKTKGGFKTLEELKNVSGIGDAKFKNLKDKIVL